MDERRNVPRREFIESYFPYINSIITRMNRNLPPGMEFNDLLSSAVIGLITSIDRYDPNREASFATFATGRIRGAILDEFRRNDKLTRKSRSLINDYERLKLKLTNELGYEPGFEEITTRLKLTRKQKEYLSRLIDASEYLLEEAEYKFENIFDSTDDLLDKINQKDIVRLRLPEAIKSLNENEKKVIISYFYEEKTLGEIGKEMNLTESRISQINKEAINKLKIKLNKIKAEL